MAYKLLGAAVSNPSDEGFSGATLVPLMLWFIINLINFYDQGYSDVVNFFSNSSSKFLFCIFIIKNVQAINLIQKLLILQV